MKLYFAPGACSLSPHIVLEEAGIAAETEQVNNQEKKTKSGKDYWTINPKGQVPALQLDSGEMLTEGPVIVQYLADQMPASGLVPPAGSIERYRVQEWLNFITSELHKSFGPIFRPTTPDAYKTISKENLGKRFDWIDKQLAGRAVSDGRQVHGRRRLSVHGAALVEPDRDRPRQVAEPEGLCGPRRGAPEGAGGDEGGRPDQLSEAAPDAGARSVTAHADGVKISGFSATRVSSSFMILSRCRSMARRAASGSRVLRASTIITWSR